ncbi:dual specificity protein phosphatase [Elysia marginata]|uniref:protein-tyrosine-phosphatase n=1 Tax=Elysia marginata TaxID=1093978 RepID=A0AAV4G732_9GAST|nr:dual specificity protein phosphatase [Elysia marginata]
MIVGTPSKTRSLSISSLELGGFCSFHQQFPKYCSRHTSFSGQLLHAKRADALVHSTLTSPGSLASDLPNTPAPKRKLSLSPVELLPYLYIGDAGHSTRKELLLGFKISAILNVSTSCENHFPTDFRYKVIPVEDSHNANLFEWFQDAILFIERERRSGGKVLVHCHGGISRSATVCLAYLMFSRHLRLDEAFDYIRARRHVISPNANFMIQLSQFETELRKLGVCWPATWSQRCPSSSSSTTTEEDMSWEDHSNRLESSSSTTSSELSWQGLARGTADTAMGDTQSDPVLVSPSIREQHQQLSESCSQRIGLPTNQKTADSFALTMFVPSNQTTNSETQNFETYPIPNYTTSEEVFLQQPPEINVSVLHQKDAPDSVTFENQKQCVEENMAHGDENFCHFSPPPKSPSLNFGCLHEKIRTSSQNFFFGSCPDIAGATFSQGTKNPHIKSTNEKSLDNSSQNDVFANGSQEARSDEPLNLSHD